MTTNTATLAADLLAQALGADYRLDLPLDPLEAGERLLTVEASQGSMIARRGVRFSVR